MTVGTCILELNLPGVRSLKEKRGVLSSLKAQIQKKFKVSVAEVDLHDVWQSATLGVAVVSTSATHAEAVLENIAHWIERFRPDVDLLEQHIETLHL